MSGSRTHKTTPWRLAAALLTLLPLLTGCLPGRSPGERLYRRHCGECHGVTGGGGIQYLADDGADLLDDSWKYGGDRREMESTMFEDKVFEHPDFDLKAEEIEQIVGHILELRGQRR